MAMQIQTRTGTAAAWASANPVLAQGELGTTTDTGVLKIGNGILAWNSLPSATTVGGAQTKTYRSMGDGADGNVTISGTVTLDRDYYYNNLSFATNGTIVPNGYRIFVKGILDLSNVTWGAIDASGANGGNATGTTGGTAGAAIAANSFGGATAGTAGPNGGTGVGAQAAVVTGVIGNGGGSNNCGAGGTSGTNAGGAAASGSTPTVTSFNGFTTQFLRGTTLSGGGAGGRGGSAGGGDVTNNGGGGGAGGSGGGMVALYANIIVTSSVTGKGAVRAYGGNGGRGGTPSAGLTGGGGGASGGGGGYIYLVYNQRVGPTVKGLLQNPGGQGGAGGNGFQSGSNYVYTVTVANATSGAVYSNNGNNYTVVFTIVAGISLVTTGTTAPLTSGTLTKVSGTGDATITFTSVSTPSPLGGNSGISGIGGRITVFNPPTGTGFEYQPSSSATYSPDHYTSNVAATLQGGAATNPPFNEVDL